MNDDIFEKIVEKEVKIDNNMTKIMFTVNKRISKGENVCLVGSLPELGNWQDFKALMTWTKGDKWQYTLEIEKGTAFEYKYAVLRDHRVLYWEHGENRIIDLKKDDQE